MTLVPSRAFFLIQVFNDKLLCHDRRQETQFSEGKVTLIIMRKRKVQHFLLYYGWEHNKTRDLSQFSSHFLFVDETVETIQ